MTNLDFLSEEIELEEPMIVEYVGDRPSLDWDRLRDANDDYDSILVDPNREFIPNLNRVDH